jgi:hypothetical protein
MVKIGTPSIQQMVEIEKSGFSEKRVDFLRVPPLVFDRRVSKSSKSGIFPIKRALKHAL